MLINLILVNLITVNAFFGSTPVVEVSDYVRGAQEGDNAYLKSVSSFTCKDGSATISFQAVNDQYCDCMDGSDEPGTAACSHVISQYNFMCKNKGYRNLQIPSSRVDDRICDCCDGSDESFIKCANTCNALKQADIQKQSKLLSEYKDGANQRRQHENNIATTANNQQRLLDQHREEGKLLYIKVNESQNVYDNEKKLEDDMNDEINSNATDSLYRSLGLYDDMSTKDMTDFLHVVLDVFNINTADFEQVYESYTKGEKWVRREEVNSVGNKMSSSNTGEDDAEDDEAANDEHYDDVYADRAHDDEEEQHPPHGDEEEGGDVSLETSTRKDTPPRNIPVIEADTTLRSVQDTLDANCFIHSVPTTDPRLLKLFCKTSEELIEQEMAALLLHIVRSVKAYHDFEILVGYFKIHRNFDNALSFLNSSTDDKESCRAEFSSVEGVCEISDHLDSHVMKLEQPYVSELAQQAKQVLDETRAAHVKSQDTRKEIKKYLKFYESFQEKGLEVILDLQNTCYEIEDGKFKYGVCILDQVYQSEIGNQQKTLLGRYSSIEHSSEGNIILSYENGQNCHAFGSRKATVTITCGRTTIIEEAREPSTCTYSFKMRSPVACSPQYADAQGLILAL
jgi:protein kinase C substrate 80K-H